MSQALRNVSRWSSLRRAGRSRFLKTAWIWLFVVPLAARLLEGADTVPIVRDWQLELPFSWRVFFLAALLTAIGDAIFMLRCPPLLKEFGTATEFVAEGAAPWRLHNFFLQDIIAARHAIGASDLAQTVNHFAETVASTKIPPATVTEMHTSADKTIVALGKLEIEQAELSDAFWIVREFEDTLYPGWRYACAFAYGTALALFLVILGQNVLSVLSSW